MCEAEQEMDFYDEVECAELTVMVTARWCTECGKVSVRA